MLDFEAPKDREVWGIAVGVRPNGRRSWSAEVKALAVQKVAEGAKVENLALETGAQPSLVAKWIADSKIQTSPQVFVEVLQAKPEPKPQDIFAGYQIRLGDVEINIAYGALPGDLTNILRAVRASL